MSLRAALADRLLRSVVGGTTRPVVIIDGEDNIVTTAEWIEGASCWKTKEGWSFHGNEPEDTPEILVVMGTRMKTVDTSRALTERPPNLHRQE